MTGKVRKISENGFAFVAVAGRGDLFMHASVIESPGCFDALHVGQELEVEVGEDPRRPGSPRISFARFIEEAA